MIDNATRQRILDSADVYEVISDFVALKKRGANYVGCCPFHNEKTASFTVSPAKGIFKCFGCGKAGDVVRFVMEYEQLGYYDALRKLAERYHIKIEERELSAQELQAKNDRDSMLVLNSFAQKYFAETLMETDEGKSVGLSYFTRRGLDTDTIRKFGLGYDPSGWDAFTKAALAAGYKKEFLLKTGLSTETQKGTLVDRFRERVMFPIKDISGKVIAFGGRIMSNEKQAAKYQNSPESEIYHKKNTLYGIDLARSAIVRKDCCYLVEGYLDVISFHMRGIENVVASSGTSLTIEQIRMIGRLTPNVTVMYDGDSAGIHAALRGIDLLLGEGLNVRVVLLPEGEDPDSYAQSHSAPEVMEYIEENETDFISFKAKLLLGDAGKDPIERAKAINDVVRTVSLVKDNIARSVYVRNCAEIMQIPEVELNRSISRILRNGAKEIPFRRADAPRQDTHAEQQEAEDRSVASGRGNLCKSEESELVRALLLYGGMRIPSEGSEEVTVASYIAGDLEAEGLVFFNSELGVIFSEYMKHSHESSFNAVKHFSSLSDSGISAAAADVLSDKYTLDSKWWNTPEDTAVKDTEDVCGLVSKLLNNYKLKRITIKIRQVDLKIKELQMSAEVSAGEIMEWLKMKKILNNTRTALVREMKRTAVQ